MAEEERTEVPLSWVGIEDLPIIYCNEVLIQNEAAEVIVTLGQVLPPPVIARDAADLRRQYADIEYVPIRPLIRIGMAPDRFRDIAAAMGAAWDKFQAAQRIRDPRSQE